MVMGELTTRADVAVIGGGPGGYTAAIRAAQLGLDVILIEKGKLGGCCTNVGCIPSKAMIHAATLAYCAANAERMGISGEARLDFGKMMEWKEGVVAGLREGIANLCRLNSVEIIQGRAFFQSSNKITVETGSGLRDIEFGKAIIATGTAVNALDSLPFDHKRIISSDDVFSLDALPRTILIVGGGYVAAEMASMFAKLGATVTLAYRGKRLLRSMEPELGDALQKGLLKLGVDVIFDCEVTSVDGKNAALATPGGERALECERILVAAGRTPYFEGFGLEKTKAAIDENGHIIVDATMRTGDSAIYAVGDAVPGPQLAHKAFRQGKIAAEAVAGKKSAFDNHAMPMVVFSEPVLASVGLTEEEARGRNGDVLVGRMPYSASGRARAMDGGEGFVKLIADRDGFILGAHIAGEGSDSLVAEAALAIEMGARLEDLAATIHAHPTMPESLMEAAEDALGKAIHRFHQRK